MWGTKTSTLSDGMGVKMQNFEGQEKLEEDAMSMCDFLLYEARLFFVTFRTCVVSADRFFCI